MTATYNNSIVIQFDTFATGNAGSNKPVTVFNAGTTSKAVLTNASLVSIPNPVSADNEGNYTFTTSNGFYDIYIDYGLPTQIGILNEQIGDLAVELQLINDLSQAYTFKTVALMQASLIVFPVGKKIFWQGYYTESDGGSNWGLVVAGAGINDGGSEFTLADGQHVAANLTSSKVSVKKFGAKGDNSNDDHAAIQATIDYCRPYLWQGNMNDTKFGQPPAVAAVYIPPGKYKVTDTILLAQDLVLLGLGKNGYFSDTSESRIVADFTDLNKFVLDTAPFNLAAQRPLAQLYTGADFDTSAVSTVSNMLISGISVDATGTAGSLNMTISTESIIENNKFWYGQVGIQLSASWAGEIRNNNIGAEAISIIGRNEITTFLVTNNYINSRGTPDPLFSWPPFAYAPEREKTCGIYMEYANLIAKDNTIEGFQHGIRAENGYSPRPFNNYMEAISDYCFVTSSADMHAVCGRTFVNNAGGKLAFVFFPNDGDVTFDVSQNEVQLAGGVDAFNIDNVTIILGANSYSTNIVPEDYLTFKMNTVPKAYVSTSGSDTNLGFNSSDSLASIKAAMKRLMPFGGGDIIIPDGEEIIEAEGVLTSADIVGDGSTFNIYPSDTTLTTTLYMSGSGGGTGYGFTVSDTNITFNDLDIKLKYQTGQSRANHIATLGDCSIRSKNCSIFSDTPASIAYFAGSLYMNTSQVMLSFDNSTVTDTQIVREDTGEGTNPSYTVWSESANNSTFTNSPDPLNYKIISTTFP